MIPPISQVSDCNWSCNQGYYLSNSALCESCPKKPENSAWDVKSGSCNYSCESDFYGHPTYPNICVLCSELMKVFWRPAVEIPAHASWNDYIGWCNSTAWSCNVGFSVQEVKNQAFCCPIAVQNSYLSSTIAPCGIACNIGFLWDSTGYNCIPCQQTLTPGNEWGPNCSITFDCKRLSLFLPANTHWPSFSGSGSADECVWNCNKGFVQNGPELCCNMSIAGFGITGQEWTSGECSLQCMRGLFSVSPSQPCVPCAQYLKESFGIESDRSKQMPKCKSSCPLRLVMNTCRSSSPLRLRMHSLNSVLTALLKQEIIDCQKKNRDFCIDEKQDMQLCTFSRFLCIHLKYSCHDNKRDL